MILDTYNVQKIQSLCLCNGDWMHIWVRFCKCRHNEDIKSYLHSFVPYISLHNFFPCYSHVTELGFHWAFSQINDNFCKRLLWYYKVSFVFSFVCIRFNYFSLHLMEDFDTSLMSLILEHSLLQRLVYFKLFLSMEMGWLHFKWAINFIVQGHVLAFKNVWYCFKGYKFIGIWISYHMH